MTKRKIIQVIISLLICLGRSLFLISQIKFNKDRDRNIVEVDLGNKTIFIDSPLQDLTGLTFMQVQNK